MAGLGRGMRIIPKTPLFLLLQSLETSLGLEGRLHPQKAFLHSSILPWTYSHCVGCVTATLVGFAQQLCQGT